MQLRERLLYSFLPHFSYFSIAIPILHHTMTTPIIITLCSLLLLAYMFDISSRLTRIPSVILLLVLGWAVRQLTGFFGIPIPDLAPLLPAFGTIGLILIVMEGSLEIEFNASKFSLIKRSLLIVIIPLVLLAALLSLTFHFAGGVPMKTALINAIPFCVISSAVAIPSVRNLPAHMREFVTYESSLCDIVGVLFFNFFAYNSVINAASFGHFFFELLIVIIISFVSVLGLSFLLSRIRYHITFAPIMLLVILLYYVSKVYHLPGLIFIMVFGLFLGNLDELKHYRWIKWFRPQKLDREVVKFKEITTEATFFIRALFFLIFGFQMNASELLNVATLPWAAGITVALIGIRWATLKVARQPVTPLVFVAPRGLITILLFMSIIPANATPLVNKSLVIQVVILSVLIMMVGLMLQRPQSTPPAAGGEDGQIPLHPGQH
jgi:hypothetical protein